MADLRSNTPCRNEPCPLCSIWLLVGLVDGARTAVDARPVTDRAERLYRLAGVGAYRLEHGALHWAPQYRPGTAVFPRHRCGKAPPRGMLAPDPTPKPRPPTFEGEYPF